jgi:hypothetical protein
VGGLHAAMVQVTVASSRTDLTVAKSCPCCVTHTAMNNPIHWGIAILSQKLMSQKNKTITKGRESALISETIK